MKTLFLLALTTLASSEALGASFYVPSNAITTEGNSSLVPFDSSTRIQQIYEERAFPTSGPDSAFLIRIVSFRADENAPAFGSATLSSLEVHLSTTSRNPDGLSTVFNENIGPDDATVFGPAPLNLNWSSGSFFTAISFDRPFFYNPAAGNLLLDIRNYSGVNLFPAFDAFDAAGDSFSIIGGRVNNTSGVAFTRGLATLFVGDIVPVPEPSTTALLLLGLVALGWKLRHPLKSFTN